MEEEPLEDGKRLLSINASEQYFNYEKYLSAE